MIGQLLYTEPLTGKNAKNEEVLSRLNSVSLVHIAAHAIMETVKLFCLLISLMHKDRKRKTFF